MGGQGSRVYSREGASLHIPALAVPVVDANGAGDAYVAGFLAGVTRGWGLTDCARMATAVGAMCVGALGTTSGIGTFAQAQALMQHVSEVL